MANFALHRGTREAEYRYKLQGLGRSGEAQRAAVMAQWGEYQSLFQLSVALNTALAAVSDFLGRAPRDGAANAHRLADRARQFQKLDDPTLNRTYASIISDFTLAQGEYERLYEKYDYVVQIGRPFLIVIALFSFAGLVRSSINYKHDIDGIWLIFSYCQFLPILGSALYALYLSIFSLRTPNNQFSNAYSRLKVIESEFNKRNAVTTAELSPAGG